MIEWAKKNKDWILLIVGGILLMALITYVIAEEINPLTNLWVTLSIIVIECAFALPAAIMLSGRIMKKYPGLAKTIRIFAYVHVVMLIAVIIIVNTLNIT